MLALVGYSLKPVKLLGPCKRTQHCWPTTPNNVECCWLWLAVWCKIQEIYIFTFNKIYLYSRHHFTSSDYIFMQLQGIIVIQLQGNDLFVNFQGNIFIQTKYIYSHKLYSFKEIIFVQGLIFIQGDYKFIQGMIFIQRNYIHSRNKLYPFKQ